MNVDINAIYEALMPYGGADITTKTPLGYWTKGPTALEVRVRIPSNGKSPKANRMDLLAKYEEIWEMLTGRFGLILEDYPSFQIHGRLMYRMGAKVPTQIEMYAEADYDCWIPKR